MIIKKFVGKNEEEATRLARESMGDGVVILNVRPLKKKGLLGLFSKPKVELTAAKEEAYEAGTGQDKKNDEEAAANKRVQPQSQHQKLSAVEPKGREFLKDIIPEDFEKARDIEENPDKENAIEEKLESIHSLIEQQMKKDTDDILTPEEGKSSEDSEKFVFLKLIYNTLIENEVDEKYANELLDDIENVGTKRFSMDYLLSNIYQKLVLKFGEKEVMKKSEDGKAKAVFFIGPTGVGKTTTIAKIASKLCVNDKAKVALLTTDTYRVKAAEQLKTYADILQIPFRIIYSTDDMDAAVSEYSDVDYILVDTAGHSPHNIEQMEAQRQFIESTSERLPAETYLVLSITTKYRDLCNIADTYSKQLKYRIVFTKLDETSALGNMLNLRLRTGAPLSYMTDGQNVPDDIEEFNAQKIVRILLGGRD